MSKRQAKEIILAINAHVIVLKSQATFAEYRDVISTVREHPDVREAAPFIFAEVHGSAGGKRVEMAMKAVDTEHTTLELDRYMVQGTFRELAPGGIVLGDELARSLGVSRGDRVQLALPKPPHADQDPPPTSFVVVGFFHTGFETYDRLLSVTSLADAQTMFGRGDQVMGVEVLVKDVRTSGTVAAALDHALGGPPYQVMDWFELNKEYFKTRE